jgi:Uma2 family endonuclease
MAVVGALLSVEEFAHLPQPAGGVRQELHHGELVEFPPVKKLHTRLQKRLIALLEARLNPAHWGVDKEFPFRPAPECGVWVADVAAYSMAAWDQTEGDDYFRGVPAIIIEVLSPSNTASEMLDRESVCLRNGGQEFWMADPRNRTVKVVRANGQSTLYDLTREIESTVLAEPTPVAALFA